VAGSNLVYLVATLRRLREMGIRQPDLERLAVLAGVGGLTAGAAAVPRIEGRARAFAGQRATAASPVRNERRHAFAYRRRLAT
jgi:hypothetical protein